MREMTPGETRRGGRGAFATIVVLVLLAVVIGLILLLVLRPGAPMVVIASPTPTPSPTPIPIDQALLSRRVTFLVLGTDQNAARRSQGSKPLTDSMIVVSVNATHTKLSMISVPRDTVDVPLPDGTVWREKLNGLFQAEGIDVTRGAFDRMLGVKIDYTIVIDMDDFASLVDAFGGVDVKVAKAINDPSIHFSIAAGAQHLDGATALAYSRSRHTTNDFERADRQQQVLLALLAKFNDPAAKIDVLALIDGLKNLKTDIPRTKLPTMAEIARRSKAAAVTQAVLQPPEFYNVQVSGPRGYILLPELAAIRAYVQPLMTGP
jgi:LCP family protein required for cell wall assembly